MTRDEIEKHPLFPAFRDWLGRAHVRQPPIIGADAMPWLDYWRAFLAGAAAENERMLEAT
jgi:hypothetical protein